MLKTIKTPLLALVVGAALAGTAAPVFAAGTDADKLQELQQKLDKSLQMIEALSARVRDLEAQKPVAPSTAVAAAGSASAPAATNERNETPPAVPTTRACRCTALLMSVSATTTRTTPSTRARRSATLIFI